MSFSALLARATDDVKVDLHFLAGPKTTLDKDHFILKEVAEFLFDLFDANCTNDFKIIAQFETESVELFIEENVPDKFEFEFTRKMYSKWQEFKVLFESLTAKFMAEELNCSPDEFYNVVRSRLEMEEEDESDKNKSDEEEEAAEEILDVFNSVCNFQVWAGEIHAQAVRVRRARRGGEVTL
ncbi:hypothetical protein ScalyP_jg1828 [Parmales sp. scaly parma]|nr:hypothetical protein ScalyP_jg1828 [Parmales sp. scaly parma]